MMVHRDRKGRLERRRIVLNDRRQIESLGHLGQDQQTELPSPVGDHKIDHLGSHFFGGADKIPLVFAVFVIHDDYELAGSDRRDGGFNG
jgi:hypothetical protein